MPLNSSYGKFVGTLAVLEIEESIHFCARSLDVDVLARRRLSSAEVK